MKGTTTTISKREIPIPPLSRSDIAFNAIGLVTLIPSPASVFCYCAVIVSVMVSILTLFMLQFHKLGHQRSDSIIVRCLQRTHLLMSPQHHWQHHRGNHDIKYCLINGWADFVMDSIGFWRGWSGRSTGLRGLCLVATTING